MFKVGVYRITNKVTNKVYIGSTNDFEKRKKQHFAALEKNNHANKSLQRDYNIYGKDNFEFSIIEYTWNRTRLQREQAHINIAGDKYNIGVAESVTPTKTGIWKLIITSVWRNIKDRWL